MTSGLWLVSCHFKRREKSHARMWVRQLINNHKYYVYILANKSNSVLYVGMTNNLERRLFEHKNKLVDGFTKSYNVNKLVYFEESNQVDVVLNREKEIKKWRREKKNKLVETMNPKWDDLGVKFGFE